MAQPETIAPTHAPGDPAPSSDTSAGPSGPLGLIRRHAAISTGVLLLIVAAVVMRAVNTRPGFDPYGWLTWGHQTLTLSLDTNAAPSWKPLPYLATVPFALAGHYQLWLWMTLSLAVTLSGCIFGARIAYRLTDAPDDRRWAAWTAAAFGAVAVLATNNYLHYILSSQSDPMIVALTLGAIDCHLSGHKRWSFWCWWLASLGRPEAWPFLAAYGVWLMWSDREMRAMVIAGAVLLLLLWFGIPAISSRSFFVAADNAKYSGRAIQGDKFTGVLKRFVDMEPTPLELAALVGLGFGIWRRDRRLIALAAIVIVWVIVEIGFAYHGWPGVQRYMFEAGGVLAALGAAAFGRLLTLPGRITAPLALAGAGLAAALVISLVPTAVHRLQFEHADLNEQHRRTAEINNLTHAFAAVGGRKLINQCGEPLTRLEYQSTVAWTLHRNVSSIGFKYGPAVASTRPIVLITPYPDHTGWVIQAMHQVKPQCKALPTGS